MYSSGYGLQLVLGLCLTPLALTCSLCIYVYTNALNILEGSRSFSLVWIYDWAPISAVFWPYEVDWRILPCLS